MEGIANLQAARKAFAWCGNAAIELAITYATDGLDSNAIKVIAYGVEALYKAAEQNQFINEHVIEPVQKNVIEPVQKTVNERITAPLEEIINKKVSTPVKNIIQNLQSLGIGKICVDLRDQILEQVRKTEFQGFFNDLDFREKESDPTTVASIKRILNILKEVEETIGYIEKFDLNATLTYELAKQLGGILTKIGPLEQSLKDLSHAVLDAETYLKPVIGSLTQHLEKIKGFTSQTLQAVDEKTAPMRMVLGETTAKSGLMGSAMVISPYILQEITSALSTDQSPKKTTKKYKYLSAKEQSYQEKLQGLKDKPDIIKLNAVLAMLLGDTISIYQNYKNLTQELYEQGQANLELIQKEILPQLQSELEGYEEQLGLPKDSLVKVFTENAQAQLEMLKKNLELAKNARLSAIIYSTYVSPVLSKIKNSRLLKVVVSGLKSISRAFKSSETQNSIPEEMSMPKSDDTALQKLRIARYQEYHTNIKELEIVKDFSKTFFKHISAEKKLDINELYPYLQPYFLDRHPHLDVKICKALSEGRTLPIQEIKAARKDVEMAINHAIAQQNFNQELLKKRYGENLKLPKDIEEVAERKAWERIEITNGKTLEVRGNDFYHQDLFGRMHQLKLSKKVEMALEKTLEKLNEMLLPVVLDELGIRGKKLSEVLASYNPNAPLKSKVAKTYQKVLNTLINSKNCLESLERIPDIEKDPSWNPSGIVATAIGSVVALATDEDPKKIKYVVGTLLPILTDGLGTVWAAQSLASDPVLSGIMGDLKSEFEPLKDLQFWAQLMGLKVEQAPQESLELAQDISEARSLAMEEGRVTSDGSDSDDEFIESFRETLVLASEELKANAQDKILQEFQQKFQTRLNSKTSLDDMKGLSDAFSKILKKIDAIGILSDEELDKLQKFIKEKHEVLQKKLIEVIQTTETKMGMKPGALFENLQLNQMISTTYVSALKKLYQLQGKELKLELEDLMSIYEDKNLTPAVKAKLQFEVGLSCALMLRDDKALGPFTQVYHQRVIQKEVSYFNVVIDGGALTGYYNDTKNVVNQVNSVLNSRYDKDSNILEKLKNLVKQEQLFQEKLSKIADDTYVGHYNPFYAESSEMLKQNQTNISEILLQTEEETPQIAFDLEKQHKNNDIEFQAFLKLTEAYQLLNQMQNLVRKDDTRYQVIVEVKKLIVNEVEVGQYAKAITKVSEKLKTLSHVDSLAKQSAILALWQKFWSFFTGTKSLQQNFKDFKKKFQQVSQKPAPIEEVSPDSRPTLVGRKI